MSIIFQILKYVITSILVSLTIFIVAFSFLTGEVPPKLESLKSLYSTLRQLNMLAKNKSLKFDGSHERKADFDSDNLLGYRNRITQREQKILEIEQGPANAGQPPGQPESYSEVAKSIRAQTLRSQSQTQTTIRIQQLKAEIERLKAENTLLRQKLSRNYQK